MGNSMGREFLGNRKTFLGNPRPISGKSEFPRKTRMGNPEVWEIQISGVWKLDRPKIFIFLNSSQ